jgi:uncharacterized membrane protein
MSKYIKQLTADLPRWVGQGWVNADHANLILKDAELNQKEGWLRLPVILAGLGALLVFLGVIAFVAANWQEMGRSFKVFLLLLATGTSLLGMMQARLKGNEGLSQGLAFLTALIFGADILLMAQIYQLPPNPPGGALLWGLIAAAIAMLWPNQMSMALAFLLMGAWTVLTQKVASGGDFIFASRLHELPVHWAFVPLWGVLAAYSLKREWNKALHAAALALLGWMLMTTGNLLPSGEDVLMHAGLVLVLVLAALAVARQVMAGQALDSLGEGAGIISKYLWLAFVVWLWIVTLISGDDFGRIGHVLPVAVALPLLLIAGASLFYEKTRTFGAAMVMAVLAQFALAGAIINAGVDHALMAILTVALAVGAIMHGYASREKFFFNLGFTLFAFKTTHIYFSTIWGLGARAPLFILGGVLLMVMSLKLDKKRRQLLSKMQEGK